MSRRGATNVDSRCTGTTMRDYLRASDLEHLPDEVVRLYDDGTSSDDKVLSFDAGSPGAASRQEMASRLAGAPAR